MSCSLLFGFALLVADSDKVFRRSTPIYIDVVYMLNSSSCFRTQNEVNRKSLGLYDLFLSRLYKCCVFCPFLKKFLLSLRYSYSKADTLIRRKFSPYICLTYFYIIVRAQLVRAFVFSLLYRAREKSFLVYMRKNCARSRVDELRRFSTLGNLWKALTRILILRWLFFVKFSRKS